MKKTKLFALLSALVVALSLFAASTFATDPTPSLSIEKLNLSVENAVYMVFKVADESVETGDMRLLVWEDVPSEYKKGTEDACLTSNEVESGTGYTVFRYTDLAAKDMTKTVYACAYANVNGTEVYSAPVKYSIVMYADMKKTASDPDEDLVAFLDTMLAYGAAAQTYFGHNTGFLATDEVHKVTVVNGTLADGFSLGWVKAGTTVTVTANAPAEGYVFSHWMDATGASVATTETAELPVDKVETYTAMYKADAPAYTEGLTFFLSSDGTYYTVADYTGSATEVVIPATYEGKPVKKIGYKAFYRCSSLTSVTFGENSQLTSIGSYAFYLCYSLTSVEIPDSVTSIGDYAFYSCDSLTSVTFGENSQLTSIGSSAFEDCDSLTSFAIPDGVKSIGSSAFEDCTSLTSITVDANNPNYSSIDGNLYNKDVTTLIQYAIGKTDTSFAILDSVTSIGSYAFAYCDSLTSVTIGDSVTSIGDWAFFYCDSLTSVEIPDSVTNIGDSAFQACFSLTSVTFGENSNLKSIGDSAFFICRSLKNIAIPEGVTSIGSHAFDSCSFTSIAIPDSVTDIGYGAFNDCAKLTNIKLSNNITSLCASTFGGCKSLTEIVIPDSVIAMANAVFSGCTSLTSITIPASVERIGSDVFEGCTGLSRVTFEATKGWSVSANGYTESGTAVTVTNSANNATYLTDTYRTYYWKRTE